MEAYFQELPSSAAPSFDGATQQSSPSTGIKSLPPPRGSPSWVFKEPKEFYAQRERQAEREARKLLRLETRRALQEQGHKVALVRPTDFSNTIDSEPPARFQKPPLSTTWGRPPFLELEPPLAAAESSNGQARKKPKQRALEDGCATINGQKSCIKQEMWNTLQGWSRGHGGTPWTLKQVYAEIEADCQHRKAKDTRKPGLMSDKEMGPMESPIQEPKPVQNPDGTKAKFRNGRMPRAMVPFERTFERKYTFASANDSFSANNSGMIPISRAPSASHAHTCQVFKPSVSMPSLALTR